MTNRSFLIIGAQKSGTTALADALSRHSEISICEPMEPEYFAATANDEPGAMSWESYEKLLKGDSSCVVMGEASTGTMLTPQVIPLIESRLDDVRLIALLRRPENRAYSGFAHHIKKGRVSVSEKGNLFNEEAERYLNGEPCQYDWFYRSEYARQLAPFVKHFGSRLKILIFEELVENQAEILASVQQFLEVSHEELYLTKENATRVPRNQIAESLISIGRKAVGPVRDLMSERGYRHFRERMMGYLGTKVPPLEKSLVERLRFGKYESEIHELEKMLGRKIPSWELS